MLQLLTRAFIVFTLPKSTKIFIFLKIVEKNKLKVKGLQSFVNQYGFQNLS